MTSPDAGLARRAAAVLPWNEGLYGHMSAGPLPEGYPHFFARGEGARVWDVNGREYIDLMCSWGPVVLGHQHPGVEAAIRSQAALGDTLNGPGPVMVELAELLTETVAHADWAMFTKNGNDATTLCVMIARAATGRRALLVANGAYHGSDPWWTPRREGTTAADRADLEYYDWNDLASVEAAVARAGGDVAALIVCPFRHDAGFEQEDADPAFAAGLRAICDRLGAALIVDDVRCGFRLNHGGSWEPLGVEPDLSAWGKAIGNGSAISAVLGSDWLREAATRIFATGSFWYSAVPMAAAIATLTALREQDGVAVMRRAGQRLRDGLAAQAAERGLEIRQSGPVQMPYLVFAADGPERTMLRRFAQEALRHGVFLHPSHNWFLSVAHTDEEIDSALVATGRAFDAVAEAAVDPAGSVARQ